MHKAPVQAIERFNEQGRKHRGRSHTISSLVRIIKCHPPVKHEHNRLYAFSATMLGKRSGGTAGHIWESRRVYRIKLRSSPHSSTALDAEAAALRYIMKHGKRRFIMYRAGDASKCRILRRANRSGVHHGEDRLRQDDRRFCPRRFTMASSATNRVTLAKPLAEDAWQKGWRREGRPHVHQAHHQWKNKPRQSQHLLPQLIDELRRSAVIRPRSFSIRRASTAHHKRLPHHHRETSVSAST